MPEVIIRHPHTDETYGIDSVDFRRGKHFQLASGERVTYADASFRIVSLADGRPYEGPLNEATTERGKD